MSDFDRTLELFRSMGLDPIVEDIGIHEKEIRLEEGKNKVGGYWCFFTVFTFDFKGKFIEVGAYE